MYVGSHSTYSNACRHTFSVYLAFITSHHDVCLFSATNGMMRAHSYHILPSLGCPSGNRSAKLKCRHDALRHTRTVYQDTE